MSFVDKASEIQSQEIIAPQNGSIKVSHIFDIILNIFCNLGEPTSHCVGVLVLQEACQRPKVELPRSLLNVRWRDCGISRAIAAFELQRAIEASG